MISSTHFQYISSKLTSGFIKHSQEVTSKFWQAVKTPQPMRELLDISFKYAIPTQQALASEINPNLPWAYDHFLERVSGQPLNPGESYKTWPFYKMDKEMRTEGEQFSHTYMERFWPKEAGEIYNIQKEHGYVSHQTREKSLLKGIRYPYGDLNDVVKQLINDPSTRQAYLPIFYPEDTGNVMNQRVPCTLGYHFIMRNDKLHITYYIRSCDYIRHFRDDVYLACKLLYWVLEKLNNTGVIVGGNIKPGNLTMHVISLHVFESDMYRLQKENEKNNKG